MALKAIVSDVHGLFLDAPPSIARVWHMFLLMPKLYQEFCMALLTAADNGTRSTVYDHVPVHRDAAQRQRRLTRMQSDYDAVFVDAHAVTGAGLYECMHSHFALCACLCCGCVSCNVPVRACVYRWAGV